MAAQCCVHTIYPHTQTSNALKIYFIVIVITEKQHFFFVKKSYIANFCRPYFSIGELLILLKQKARIQQLTHNHC